MSLSAAPICGLQPCAGAPTLFGSLWPVESIAVKEHVTRFFKEWRSAEENGASAALARATRAYLDASDGSHQHSW
jgi:CHAT domain-containing protein